MNTRAPRAVADVLVDALPQLSERLAEYRIRRSWTSLVGADVARRARPRALVNGCLEVAVDNSPWLHELTLRATELGARLAAQGEGVRALRFTLAPLDPAPPAGAAPPERRERALSGDDLRAIDAAAVEIPDAALADAVRRLMTKAWRFPLARGARR